MYQFLDIHSVLKLVDCRYLSECILLMACSNQKNARWTSIVHRGKNA